MTENCLVPFSFHSPALTQAREPRVTPELYIDIGSPMSELNPSILSSPFCLS